MSTNTRFFKESQGAFDSAISSGILSALPTAANYAGHYMYMGSDDKGDDFKHRDTREYLTVANDDNLFHVTQPELV